MKSAFKLVAILLLILLVMGTFDLGKLKGQQSQEKQNTFALEEGGIWVEYSKDGKPLIKIKCNSIKYNNESPTKCDVDSGNKKITLTYKGETFEINPKIQLREGGENLTLKELQDKGYLLDYAPYKKSTDNEPIIEITLTINAGIKEKIWRISLFVASEKSGSGEEQVKNSQILFWALPPSKEDFKVDPNCGPSKQIPAELNISKNDTSIPWPIRVNYTVSCKITGSANVETVAEEHEVVLPKTIKIPPNCEGDVTLKIVPALPEIRIGNNSVSINFPINCAQEEVVTNGKEKKTVTVTETAKQTVQTVIRTVPVPSPTTKIVEKVPRDLLLLAFGILALGIGVMSLGLRKYWDARDYTRFAVGDFVVTSLLDNPTVENLRFRPTALNQLSVDPIGAIVQSLQEYDSKLSSSMHTISQLQNQLRQKEIEINNLRTQLERYRSHRLDTLMRDLLEKARRLSSYGPQAQSVSTLVNDLYRVYSRDMTGTSKEVEVLRLISSRLDELLSLYQREALKKNQLKEALSQKISAVESQLALMRQKLNSMAQNYHIKLPRGTLKLAETFLERARAKLAQDKFEEAVALTEAAIIVLKELDAQLKNTEYLSMLRILREKFWSV